MRDFGFAFNDNDFSDRILHVEIISEEPLDSKSDRKRKRDNLDMEKGDATHSSDSDSEGCAHIKVTTLHINSAILAEKSSFFYKLFKNGMIESQQIHSTLRISAYEEAALMDLLKFMYNNTVSATTTSDLMNVLMVADKFGVISCMRYCSELLQSFPMSLESALLYLELPTSVSMSDVVQPLIDAAVKYVCERYMDIHNKSYAEVMVLPLSALEVVLGSDGLQANTEDSVFRFILKWARAKYPNLEERREILTKQLAQFICFRCMSGLKLKEVLVCPDIDHEQVSKLVLDALFFKAKVPNGQQINCSFPRRVYNCRIIKVMQCELPRPRCVVHFELRKEACVNLFPPRIIVSQPFCLGGRWFCLMVGRLKEQQSSAHQLGLVVHMKGSFSETRTLDVEFAAKKKPLKKFVSQYMAKSCTLTGNKFIGCRNLLKITWNELTSDDSEYFIDGILHLQAKLTLSNSQALT